MQSKSHTWKPIERLSESDRKIDLAAIRPLYDTWRASKARLESESAENFKEFSKRLIRRLSIETGILERLYDLDRGATEALVLKGFAEELISRSNTDIEPARLIDILRAQEAAIQLVMDCVSKSRRLTKGIINELQSILTQHQDTTTAVDPRGVRREIPLLKGRFKDHPNNPRRPDGSIHEYCPPVHVESEMDNLLNWVNDDSKEDPIILASWFHHRFTQIHPYQDGNGRVARALTTLVLLKAELLPLVVDRDLRVSYIDALEAADRGELSSLAAMFANLERTAILQALSIDADADISHQRSVTSAVIETLAEKFGKRRQSKQAELREVNTIALALRDAARISVIQTLQNLKKAISAIAESDIHVHAEGSDKATGHWYKSEVWTTAKKSGKLPNFTENHYLLKASIRAEQERLVFVISFHHIGRELTGIMEATAFARLESFEGPDDREVVAHDFFVCSLEPFVFTYKTDADEIAESFKHWLDGAVAIAVKEYGDRL